MFILFLFPLVAIAGQSPANLGSIAKAIESGDANALSTFFDSSVELAILDEEDIYDKADAVAVLNTFFSKHKPGSYSQVHKGASKNADSQYAIGKLVANGQQFRVYVYMKSINGNYVIQEMRFDKE